VRADSENRLEESEMDRLGYDHLQPPVYLQCPLVRPSFVCLGSHPPISDPSELFTEYSSHRPGLVNIHCH
jgi:hypothetical protein